VVRTISKTLFFSDLRFQSLQNPDSKRPKYQNLESKGVVS
jgi:hypothetical protein